MPENDPLYVKSKIRDYLKTKDVNISSEFMDGNMLNTKMMELLDNAVRRAKENNRKTLYERDL